MEKVAVYLRKSRGEIEDLEKHRMQLLEITEKNNWEYDVFEEIGSSDSIESRPRIKNLLECIKNGLYKKVVIVSVDRLSRNEFDQAKITRIFKENNVEIVTPSKVYNLNTENDLLMSDFEKLIARQEYRLIKKRLFIGKENGAKQGYWTNGIPPIPYKYDKVKKELLVDKEFLNIYRLIISKMLEGKTTSGIAWELNTMGIKSPKGNDWHNNTVRRIATDVTQLGKINYKGQIYEGKHKAVKTLDEHEKIKLFLGRLTKAPKRRKDKQKNIFALSGLVKCQRCGASHYIYIKDDGQVYIRACWKHDKYGNKCGNSGIKEKVILEQIQVSLDKHINKLQKNLADGVDNKERIRGIQQNIELIKNKINKSHTKIQNIKDMIREGIYSIIEGKEELSKIENDKYNDAEMVEILQNQLIKLDINQKEQQLLNAKSVLNVLYTESDEEKLNDLLRTVIKRINYFRDGDNIKVNVEFL